MNDFLDPSTFVGAVFAGIIAGLISGLIIGFFSGKAYVQKAQVKIKGNNNNIDVNSRSGGKDGK